MVVPILPPGMEQFGNLVRLRIDARQVRPLMQVAINTGKGKVVGIVSPAMNLRNNMLNMQRDQRRVVALSSSHQP